MSDSVDKLWSAVMLWAGHCGAKGIDTLPSTWSAISPRLGLLGPFSIEINGHPQDHKNIPPFAALIKTDSLPGLIACCEPMGSTVMRSRNNGEDYDGLLDYFTALQGKLTEDRDQYDVKQTTYAAEKLYEFNAIASATRQLALAFLFADQTDWDYIERLLKDAVRHERDAQTKFWITVLTEARAAIQSLPPALAALQSQPAPSGETK